MTINGRCGAIRGLLLLVALTALARGQANKSEQASKEIGIDANRAYRRPAVKKCAEGITERQADSILKELKQIRQLLEKQQIPGIRSVAEQPQQISQSVNMSIEKGWYSLGRGDAPLALVEFTDYQCPFCQGFQANTFADLKKNYIDTGQVRFFSRDLPLEFHQNAFKAAEAARCAGEQGKFWEMRDVLISHSADLSHDAILKFAQGESLDVTSFRVCMDQEQEKTEIEKDSGDAKSLQISGTPTFVLGKVSKGSLSGIIIVGAQPYSFFNNLIQQMLKENP